MAITKAKANGPRPSSADRPVTRPPRPRPTPVRPAWTVWSSCRGKDRPGKLAQAIVYGARVLQIRGNFDQALNLARELTQHLRSRSSTRSIPIASRVKRPAPSRSSTCSARRPTSCRYRSATPATLPPTGGASRSTTSLNVARYCPRCGFPGRWRGAHRPGHPVTNPETIATAIRIGNPASWIPALEVIHESLGDIRAVTDDEILEAYRYVARHESIFCEPASAASIAASSNTASRRIRRSCACSPATD